MDVLNIRFFCQVGDMLRIKFMTKSLDIGGNARETIYPIHNAIPLDERCAALKNLGHFKPRIEEVLPQVTTEYSLFQDAPLL